MAKVKIQGHASGTGILTVTAPNTSTDRTITLPDTTGTLLDENSSLPAANLTGTIASARITASSIADDLLDSQHYTAGSIDNEHLADDAVGTGELANDVVISTSGSITTTGAFTSIGIDDNADANAITISSSEKVRVGTTSQADKALLSTWQNNTDAGTSIGGTNLAMAMQHYGGANSVVQMGLGYCVNHPPAVIGYQVETNTGNTKGDIFFATRDTTNDDAPTERLRIKVDGRGLSQFTAKAWVNFNGTGTVAIRDSHNVSSITDNDTGRYTVTYSNNMADTNYFASYTCGGSNGSSGDDSYGTFNDSRYTSSIYLRSRHYDGTVYDIGINMVSVFGD